jgi:hypothetical protein
MEEGNLNKTRVRGGTTPHMTRYILPISLGLVIVAFLLILLLWR